MRHAFLIIAHSNWWQLKQLIMLLDDESHDIYVHIDKKSQDFNFGMLQGLTKKSCLECFQEYKVYWGGYSVVQAEMLLFEQSYRKGYDYYHMLSGMDLPLKTNAEIHYFFEQHKGKEFISYDEDKLKNDAEIGRRTRLYHFLQNYRRNFKAKWINAFFTFWERGLLAMQIVFHVNRVKNLDWVIKYGSNWVSITNELVEVLLHQKEKIEKVFSYTNCADELFVQTIAYNCGFRDSIYKGNIRLVDWERGSNGNPYIFVINDFKMLWSSDVLFARKFSETIDTDIIRKVISELQKEKELRNAERT